MSIQLKEMALNFGTKTTYGANTKKITVPKDSEQGEVLQCGMNTVVSF